MRSTILLLAAALACTVPATNTTDFRDRDWTLFWVEGFSSFPSDVATPTIRFGSDGRLGGNTGCNTAGADYTAEGDALTIGMMSSTKRACLNPEGNSLETAYMRAVGAAKRYRITNGQLELLDAGGKVVARFR